MKELTFNDRSLYFVAVKVFLRDGDKLLLVHDVWNNWELPGGRIKPHEFKKSLTETVERKMREELGDDVKYSGLKPTGTFFQVERFEDIDSDTRVKIFAIGFEAQYDGGEIKLSDNHDELKWVDVKTFQPLELQDNDWMHGVEDYLKKIR
jgi:8-oxo-dGTP diphosphatase